jgi:hypothetical protein
MPTLYNCGRGSPVSKIVNSRGSIQRREARQCQGGPLSSRHNGGMSEGRFRQDRAFRAYSYPWLSYRRANSFL